LLRYSKSYIDEEYLFTLISYPNFIVGYNSISQKAYIEKLAPNSSQAFIDGTFKCTPKDAYQTVTFRVAKYNKKSVLAALFVLRSKNPSLATSIKYVSVDFEPGLRKAIKKVFPEWIQIGCIFHKKKAILSKCTKKWSKLANESIWPSLSEKI